MDSPASLAALSALAGAVVLELLRAIIARARDATQHQHSELQSLRDRVRQLEGERDGWRDRYYTLLERRHERGAE